MCTHRGRGGGSALAGLWWALYHWEGAGRAGRQHRLIPVTDFSLLLLLFSVRILSDVQKRKGVFVLRLFICQWHGWFCRFCSMFCILCCFFAKGAGGSNWRCRLLFDSIIWVFSEVDCGFRARADRGTLLPTHEAIKWSAAIYQSRAVMQWGGGVVHIIFSIWRTGFRRLGGNQTFGSFGLIAFLGFWVEPFKR